MMILSLVRDYHNQHAIVKDGGWNIADAVQRSYDVEGMHVGTVAAGRIGLDALRKMKPFITLSVFKDSTTLTALAEVQHMSVSAFTSADVFT